MGVHDGPNLHRLVGTLTNHTRDSGLAGLARGTHGRGLMRFGISPADRGWQRGGSLTGECQEERIDQGCRLFRLQLVGKHRITLFCAYTCEKADDEKEK